MDGSGRSAPLGLLEAYRARAASLQLGVNRVLERRDRLVHRAARLQARSDEVEAMRQALEREVRQDAEEALQRLRSEEQLKLMALKRDADEVARDLTAVNAFVEEAKRVSTSAAAGQGEAVLAFLGKHAALEEEAERLAARPMRQGVPVEAADLGSAIARAAGDAAAASSADEAAALRRLLGVKDVCIEHLLNERRQLRRQLGLAPEGDDDEEGAGAGGEGEGVSGGGGDGAGGGAGAGLSDEATAILEKLLQLDW